MDINDYQLRFHSRYFVYDEGDLVFRRGGIMNALDREILVLK